MRILTNGTLEAQSQVSVKTARAEEVIVTVNPDGSVKNAVVKRSIDAEEDRLTLNEARKSRYRPKTVNCVAVEGTFHFWVYEVRTY